MITLAPERTTGNAAPGTRRTLSEMLEDALRTRPLPGGMDREAFVTEGVAFLASVEHDGGEG